MHLKHANIINIHRIETLYENRGVFAGRELPDLLQNVCGVPSFWRGENVCL